MITLVINNSLQAQEKPRGYETFKCHSESGNQKIVNTGMVIQLAMILEDNV